MDQPILTKVSYEISAATDEGLVGKNNEDAYGVFQAWLNNDEPNQARPVQVAVVADGVGGSAAGERASKLAVKIIEHEMKQDSVSPISQRMEKAIRQANTAIFELAAKIPKLKGMGTTVVVAAIIGGELYVAHAGDSRAYLIRAGQAHPLTKDHTWAQEAIDAGYLTPEEAAKHPNRHVIKRFLGITREVAVDHQIMGLGAENHREAISGRRPVVDRLRLRPGDTLLLCTDGLTDVVDDEKIQQAVSSGPAQEASRKLIELANRAGGPDNITAVLVHWPNGRPRSRTSTRRLALLATASAILLVLLLGIFNPGLIDALALDSLRGWLSGTLQPRPTPATGAASLGKVTGSGTRSATGATSAPLPSSTTPMAARTSSTAAGDASMATSTATPIPTQVEAATVQVSSPTSTLAPSTLVPTPTPVTPTLTPTNNPTPTATIEATVYPTIDLVQPSPGENIKSRDSAYVFQWRFGDSCSPLEDEGFEVRVGRKEETLTGIMDAQKDQDQITCDGGGQYSFKIQHFKGILTEESGELYWSIHLVKVKPGYVPTPLAEAAPLSFTIGE